MILYHGSFLVAEKSDLARSPPFLLFALGSGAFIGLDSYSLLAMSMKSSLVK
jgi:hypothetical protein